MTGYSELVNSLKEHIPPELAEDLVNDFTTMRMDISTKTLERSSPGKFIETVVQILQFLEAGTYEKDVKVKVDDYLKNLENRSTKLSDNLKLVLARVARASYTIRNKRNIAHKGSIDSNIYDLKYLYSASQWILSEIVRSIFSTDIVTANNLIELIQIPVNTYVDKFEDKKLVLYSGTAEEELLILCI